ncbi:Tannase/feruloyl esterase [Xylariales sp. PMI_506]|nr:Tannase/feruloyl esterase [Xylariales sp. PMI_506]
MTSAFESLCATSYVQGLVSTFNALPDVVYNPGDVSTAIFSNYTSIDFSSIPDSPIGPEAPGVSGLTFCNVTVSLTHTGLDDVYQQFWVPEPSQFQGRYLTNGGGGWMVSGFYNLGAGLSYGAVSGTTDAGFGGFESSLTSQLLQAAGNGTMDWNRVESMGYQAIHELTVTGKELTKAFYNITDDELYSYYLGCSEGGREGHMSTQRYPEDFDGVVAGAPAMFWAPMQLAQGWPNIKMAELNHWPSPCAFEAIQEDFIAACDPLDGLVDGIISRSDLCTYNASSSVGKTWSNCTSGGDGAPTSGTISDLDAEVVDGIYKGPFDSNDNQIFWTYQPGTTLTVEATVEWDNATQSFVGSSNSYFETYYQNMVLKNTVAPTISYDNFTVDDVYQLMKKGIQDYGSFLQTTWPDLTDFQQSGGKLIHWHGEQDTNLFPQASAHFYEKVKAAMFAEDADYEGIQSFYRFFRVPGAAHCAINAAQPNGPYPQYAMEQMIDWVESGVEPAYLNGTTQSNTSTQSQICMWPTAPFWAEDGTFTCQNTSASSFISPLNAWKIGSLL